MNKDSLKLYDEFIKYNSSISNFENYIKEIYNKPNNEGKKGYIINNKDFEEFKANISKDKYNLFGIKKEDFQKYFDLNKFNKIKKLKQIEFKTSQYLINMILNDNKYIIINEELWKIICDKKYENDSPIIYYIDTDSLYFNFENEKILYFDITNKNNLISQYTYNHSKKKSDYISNFDEMNKIYNDIKSYFDYENEFKANLKKKKAFSLEYHSKSGYLISKIWIDNWKNFCNYEEIKKKLKEFVLDGKKLILNKIIYYQEEYKLKYDQLEPLKILAFNTKEEFEEFLKKDSLVLINNNLKFLFHYS